MKSLFSEEAYTEINSRIANLSHAQKPEWGKMSISQMLKHCQLPLKVALGKLQLEKPNAMKRMIFSLFRSSLYNDKPWKKGLPTAKEYVVSEEMDFDKERTKLLTEIEDFHAKKNQNEWPIHPMFGNFTSVQWGQMQYKHLDHHLRQFGV